MSDEHLELAMATTGDLAALRGAIEVVVDALCPSACVEVEPAEALGMDPGAAGRLLLDGQPAGSLGIVSDQVRDFYALVQPVAVAAIRVDAIVSRAQAVREYRPIARFPAVKRDLSLIVDEPTTWRQLAQTIQAVAQPDRTAVEYVTTYRGAPVPPGRKSVTVTLVYRSAEQTLRSDDVDRQVAEVLDAARKQLAAELRA